MMRLSSLGKKYLMWSKVCIKALLPKNTLNAKSLICVQVSWFNDNNPFSQQGFIFHIIGSYKVFHKWNMEVPNYNLVPKFWKKHCITLQITASSSTPLFPIILWTLKIVLSPWSSHFHEISSKHNQLPSLGLSYPNHVHFADKHPLP